MDIDFDTLQVVDFDQYSYYFFNLDSILGNIKLLIIQLNSNFSINSKLLTKSQI